MGIKFVLHRARSSGSGPITLALKAMSDIEQPRTDDGSGEGGEISGANVDEGERPTEKIDRKEKKCRGCGKTVRRASLFRFRKGRKLINQKKKQKGFPVRSVGSARSGGGRGDKWCCLGLKQPRTLGSSGESPTSDPNSSDFTFDMLRALIEKNDFYSEDCNTYLDSDG